MDNKKKVLTPEVKKELLANRQTEISRRSFLKRSAYSAPVLMVMGQLARPTRVHADASGGPEEPPTGWNP